MRTYFFVSFFFPCCLSEPQSRNCSQGPAPPPPPPPPSFCLLHVTFHTYCQWHCKQLTLKLSNMTEITPGFKKCSMFNYHLNHTQHSKIFLSLLNQPIKERHHTSSDKNQKGINAVQQCFVENQKGTRYCHRVDFVKFVCSDSPLLVLNRTSLNSD